MRKQDFLDRVRLLIGITLLLLPGLALSNEIAIIAHPSVTIHELDYYRVRLIWSLSLVSADNRVKLRVVSFRESSPIHRRFTLNILKLRPAQLSRQWNRSAYSGSATPPILVDTPEQMLSRVASVPGAIGYISTINLGQNNQHEVKVIKITGEPE